MKENISFHENNSQEKFFQGGERMFVEVVSFVFWVHDR